MQTSLSLFPHSYLPSTPRTLSLYAPPSPPPLLLHSKPPRFDYNLSNEARLNNLHIKRRKVDFPHQVFDEIPKQDVNAWTTLITRFVRNGMLREVLEYTRLIFEEGMNPNLVVVTVILDVIGKVRDRKLGREAHGFVLKMNLYYNELSIQSALIDMYWKCGDVGSGSRVLYNVMKGYGDCWKGLMSCRLEVEMRSVVRLKRFRPGAVAVASLLPICAKLRALKQGKEIHAYALRHWLLPNVSIVSSLMVLYSKCGVIEYSMRLFDGMDRRNVISWTAMIDSCVENGHLCEAIGVMRSMVLAEHKPDTVTAARMLRVCGELKVLKLGKEVHGLVLKRGFATVHYVAAELIDMYGICGDVDKAKLVFGAIPVKGSMTWSALIRAYGYKEWYQEAVDLFDDMISNGCAPNRFTFEAVLSICDRAGFVEDAFRIFDLMSRYKVEASKEHCTCMIRLLTRYGVRISKEEYLKSKKKVEEKPKEIEIEWGKGLAQKREAEATLKELELEKEKPFAWTRDDPELDKMLKERLRWGDPMAHLVKRKYPEPVLPNLGENEKMKESGFVVPQDIPNHSWLKRGLDAALNRYGIRPGRHWDGVDRSNGFEKDMFKRTNERQARDREAYLWSVSDM